MKYLSVLYASLRALMIAGLASGVGDAQAQEPADRDAAAWSAARGAGTVEGYQRYLELYPVGRHANEAFRRIVELTIAPDLLTPERIAPGAGPGDGGTQSPLLVERGLSADIY